LLALIPGGQARSARRAIIGFVALAALGVGAAWGATTLPAAERVYAASALFAVATTLAIVLLDGVAWLQLASVLAVACQLLGITSPLPWAAAILAWVLVKPPLLRARA